MFPIPSIMGEKIATKKTGTLTVTKCVCVWILYLPGMTSPPAGLCGDAQPPAAGLLGHEGELPHRAASETVERGRHGNAHHGCPGNQQEEEGKRQAVEMEMHAGNYW